MNKKIQKLADTYTLQKITQAAGYTQADKEANNKPKTVMSPKLTLKSKLTKKNITRTPIKNRKKAYKTMEKFWDNNVQLVKDHLPVPPRQGLIWDNVKSKWVRPEMAGKTITEVGGGKRIRGAGTGTHQRAVQTKRGLRRGEARQAFRQPGLRRQKRI